MDCHNVPPPPSHKNIKDMTIFLGKNAINESDASREQRFKVQKLITHEAYNDEVLPYYNNDIGKVT